MSLKALNSEYQEEILANEREWVDTHSLLAGKPMTEEECLPYVFKKLMRLSTLLK